jgi:hypothetical protein
MAKRKRESGEARQDRIQQEQHRPEQNRGYDEAVRGDSGVAADRPDRMVPVSGDESQLQNTSEDVDEREARRARQQVPEHDASAARPRGRES